MNVNELTASSADDLAPETTAAIQHASPRYTANEELANVITHAIGAALSVAGLCVLVTMSALHGDVWRVVSFSVYGTSSTLLYLFSTLYHAFSSPRIKRAMRVCDHISIYLLIAGTYTPFTLVSLTGAWGWSLFGVIWGLALIGGTMKIFTTGRWRLASTLIYIGMGWVVLVAMKPLTEALPLGGLLWLTAGGLAYTAGVAFYSWRSLPYHHAIWHCFVLAGGICHFMAIYLYVLPMN
ncbi:MAG: hemolysin III family protein [bacterium]|nr:hemolysin III family protein [bacterium]